VAEVQAGGGQEEGHLAVQIGQQFLHHFLEGFVFAPAPQGDARDAQAVADDLVAVALGEHFGRLFAQAAQGRAVGVVAFLGGEAVETGEEGGHKSLFVYGFEYETHKRNSRPHAAQPLVTPGVGATPPQVLGKTGGWKRGI